MDNSPQFASTVPLKSKNARTVKKSFENFPIQSKKTNTIRN